MTKAEIAHLHDCVEALKRDVKANHEVLEQVRDILASFRVVGSVAKWLAAIVAAAVAIYHGVQFWRA